MSSSRKTAIIVGVLFIIATVAGVLSISFMEPLTDSEYLTKVAQNESQVLIGGLLMLVMGFSVTAIGIVMFPIMKKDSEALAFGYSSLRIIEGVLFILSVVSILSLVEVSQQFIKAGAPEAPYFRALGAAFREENYWTYHMGTISFGVAAALFYFSLFRSKLIPRFLTIWGLIGVPFWLVWSFSIFFGSIAATSTVAMLLYIPIALNEMVMALWLIIKGFNE